MSLACSLGSLVSSTVAYLPCRSWTCFLAGPLSSPVLFGCPSQQGDGASSPCPAGCALLFHRSSSAWAPPAQAPAPAPHVSPATREHFLLGSLGRENTLLGVLPCSHVHSGLRTSFNFNYPLSEFLSVQVYKETDTEKYIHTWETQDLNCWGSRISLLLPVHRKGQAECPTGCPMDLALMTCLSALMKPFQASGLEPLRGLKPLLQMLSS